MTVAVLANKIDLVEGSHQHHKKVTDREGQKIANVSAACAPILGFLIYVWRYRRPVVRAAMLPDLPSRSECICSRSFFQHLFVKLYRSNNHLLLCCTALFFGIKAFLWLCFAIVRQSFGETFGDTGLYMATSGRSGIGVAEVCSVLIQ